MRIGSRGSKLALAQARQVAALLGDAELLSIATSGDRPGERAPRPEGRLAARRGASAGEKTRWVDAIEEALLDGTIDIAVHSAKDVPSELAPGLALLGAPLRAATEDVICGAAGLEELCDGATVGTTSLRRAAQLRAERPDLKIVPLAGNVDTRLRKLADDPKLSAIVLAKAGIERLGRQAEIGGVLDCERFVPAPGQGTLALEGRVGDERAAKAAAAISDACTFACLQAERALASALEASCDTPLGAHASQTEDGSFALRAWVGLPDGSVWLSDEVGGDEVGGDVRAPMDLAVLLAERMRSAGADRLLREAARAAREAEGAGAEASA